MGTGKQSGEYWLSHRLVNCGIMDVGQLWNCGCWITVELWTLGNCGIVGVGQLWNHGRWTAVESWTLDNCGIVDVGHLWNCGCWATVELWMLGNCGIVDVEQLWNCGCWTTVELWIDSQEGKDTFLFSRMSGLALGPSSLPLSPYYKLFLVSKVATGVKLAAQSIWCQG